MSVQAAVAIFGINPVAARLRSGRDGVHKLILRDSQLSARQREIEMLARDLGIAVERLSDPELARMTDVTHQGVALMVDPARVLHDADLKDIIQQAEHHLLIVVLDGVTDPRNLGACLRSAATFGVDAVIIPRNNSVGLTPAAVKTASGGAEAVAVVEVVNLARCLTYLQQQNVWVVGTLLDATQALHEVDLTGHIALVLGAEGTGLRPNTVKHCDYQVRIPMVIPDFGLNVSVAAGICLYEACRQRGLHRVVAPGAAAK
jgi:23S rRNA (guanosine2251-2'-O)-methyltransferase